MKTSKLTGRLLSWRHIALAVLALVVVPGLALGSALAAPAGAAGAKAWIENPTAGQTLPLGPVHLVVYATDAAGVAQIDLKINGAPLPAAAAQQIGIDPTRKLVRLEQQWTPDKEGKYILEARGRNAAGGYGEPAFIEFCVGHCKGPVALTATPSPAPSPAPVRPGGGQLVQLQIAFTADRTQLRAGECAVLQWAVQGNAAVVQLNGQQAASSGQQQVCPPQTTTYILIAIGADGKRAARDVTIIVQAIPPTATFTPTPAARPTPTPTPVWVVTLTADRTSLRSGECAVLQWAVRGDAAIVALNGQAVNPSGQSRACPAQTTVYTLAATRRDGVRTQRAVTIAVQATAPTPTPTLVRRLPAAADIRLWVDHPSLAAGSCTTLRWHVANVQAYWVDGQAGSGDDGSRQVCPCQDETHTLHVVKSDGSPQDLQVTIHVQGQCVTPIPIAPVRPVRPLLPTATPTLPLLVPLIPLIPLIPVVPSGPTATPTFTLY